MIQKPISSKKSPFLSIHFFLLVCVAAILFWQVNRLINTSNWVKHTSEVIAKTNFIGKQVVDLESGIRGFVITADPVFMEFNDKASLELPSSIESLRKLTLDNPQQLKRIDQVVAILTNWKKFSKSVIDLKNSKGDPTALIRSKRGKILIDSIRVKIEEILSAEEQLIVQRQAAELRQSKRIFRILLVVFILLGFWLFRSLLFRRRWEIAIQESNSQLEISEDRYREAEMNLNLALGSAKMGTWWMDAKTAHTQMSASLAALYGVTETEGQNPDLIAKLIHPDDRASFQLKLTEALQSLKPIYHEFRIIRSDGEVRWHYSRSAFTFDKDGKPLRLYGIQGDRTENKIQSDKLRDSEEKYRNLVADAQDGVLIVDETGQIIFGNHQVEVMFGYSSDELLNQPIELLVPAHLRTAHIQVRDGYLVNPTKRPIGRIGLVLNGRRKDGSEFPVDIGLSPSVTQNGKIVTAIIRDVTERKRREEQVQFLVKANQVLTESFDKADTMKKMAELAVSEISDGCIVRLIGEDAKLHLAAVVHRDPKMQQALEGFAKSVYARGVLPSEIGEALQTKKIQIRNDFSEIRKADLGLDSEEIHYLEQLGEFNAVVIPLRVGTQVIGMLSIMLDKSKRRYEESDIGFLESIGNQIALSIENVRLYNKAQAAIKLREEILAIVSHDLRNPLSMIQMTGQLLPKIIDDKAKIISFSEKILRSTDQMKRMTEDLMDFAKIQEGNLSIEKKVEEPKAVLEMVIEMMKAQAEEKGLNIFLSVNSELPVVMYDKQRIAQALLNLVGNAIKFTEIGGSIRISAEESMGAVKFSVTDTGPGISEEDLPKIFDRYWQAKRSKAASAGLGLSITKGIIEAHGSQIRVESQLGKGSTFYFVLPVLS